MTEKGWAKDSLPHWPITAKSIKNGLTLSTSCRLIVISKCYCKAFSTLVAWYQFLSLLCDVSHKCWLSDIKSELKIIFLTSCNPRCLLEWYSLCPIRMLRIQERQLLDIQLWGTIPFFGIHCYNLYNTFRETEYLPHRPTSVSSLKMDSVSYAKSIFSLLGLGWCVKYNSKCCKLCRRVCRTARQ